MEERKALTHKPGSEKQLSAVVRASTVLAGSPSGAQVWAVLELSGFTVTDPSQATFARYVLNNIMGSMRMNPQWEARQAQATKDVTGAVIHAQRQMAASIASMPANRPRTIRLT